MILNLPFEYFVAWPGVIAIQSELEPIGLSDSGSGTGSFWWKFILCSICALNGIVIWQQLNVSVANKASEKIAISETAEMLK